MHSGQPTPAEATAAGADAVAHAEQLARAGQLRDAGLRVTAPRLRVLETLAHGEHFSAEMILGRVRTSIPGTSLQTVYGVLDAFCRVGLARKIEPAGGKSALFEANRHDNHHHLVCRSCGAVVDTPCVHAAAPCLTPPTHGGFTVEQADVTFYGLCGTCRAARSTP